MKRSMSILAALALAVGVSVYSSTWGAAPGGAAAAPGAGAAPGTPPAAAAPGDAAPGGRRGGGRRGGGAGAGAGGAAAAPGGRSILDQVAIQGNGTNDKSWTVHQFHLTKAKIGKGKID